MAREQDMKQTRKKHGAAFKAKVEKLSVMKEAGLLSEEEFNSMKAQLMASIL